MDRQAEPSGLARSAYRVVDGSIWRGGAEICPPCQARVPRCGAAAPKAASVGSRVGLWLRSECEEPAGLGGRDGLDTWPARVARRPLALFQLVPCFQEGAKLSGRVYRRVPDQSRRRRGCRASWAGWLLRWGLRCQSCLGTGRISDLPVGYNF